MPTLRLLPRRAWAGNGIYRRGRRGRRGLPGPERARSRVFLSSPGSRICACYATRGERETALTTEGAQDCLGRRELDRGFFLSIPCSRLRARDLTRPFEPRAARLPSRPLRPLRPLRSSRSSAIVPTERIAARTLCALCALRGRFAVQRSSRRRQLHRRAIRALRGRSAVQRSSRPSGQYSTARLHLRTRRPPQCPTTYRRKPSRPPRYATRWSRPTTTAARAAIGSRGGRGRRR